MGQEGDAEEDFISQQHCKYFTITAPGSLGKGVGRVHGVQET